MVLVIATESRQAYFSAGGTKTLSSDRQTKVYPDYIKPKLQNSDYSGAALAAVEGIEAQKGGSSSGVVTGVLGVGAAATVGAGGYAMYRRRKKKTLSSSLSVPTVRLVTTPPFRRFRWRSCALAPVAPCCRLIRR